MKGAIVPFTGMDQGWRLKELLYKVCKTALVAEKAIKLILCQGVSSSSSEHSKTR